MKDLENEISKVKDPAPAPRPVQVQANEESSVQYLRRMGDNMLGPGAAVGVVLVIATFMLLERDDLRHRLLRLSGAGRLLPVTRALNEAATRVGQYLGLLFCVNAVFGSMIAGGLYWIGLPNPILWGALAGLARTIPYVGAIVAAALPFTLSLAVFSDWIQPLLVLALFLTLDLLSGNFLEPLLYGAHTGVSSLALLIAAVFWTVLWGPAGLVLSTPLTVCLVVIGRHISGLTFLHELLADKPGVDAEAALYQRATAGDSAGVRRILEDALGSRPAVDVVDEVFVPALRLAEGDFRRGMFTAGEKEALLLCLQAGVACLIDCPDPSRVAASDARRPELVIATSGDGAALAATDLAASVLRERGFKARTGTSGLTMVESLRGTSPDDVICLSAVPGTTAGPILNAWRNIRKRHPVNRLIIAAWGASSEVRDALAGSIRDEHSETVITTLRDLVSNLAEPVERIRLEQT